MKYFWNQLLFNTLRSKSGLSQVIVSVGGNAASMTISAIAMLLISRTLEPVNFGIFSVGFAVLLILNKISDLGLTFAQLKYVPRLTSETDKNQLFSYIVRTKLLISLAIAVVGTICTPLLATLLDFPYHSILYLGFWLNVLTVLYEQLMAMLQSLHRFSEAAVSGVIQAMGKLVSAIAIGIVFPKSVVLAFISYAVAPILPVFFSKTLLPKSTRLSAQLAKNTDHKVIASMAGHSAIGFISLGIIDNIDILFVQRYLNDFETGLLGGSSKIAMLFSLSAYALSTVLNSRVARYRQKSHIYAFIKKGVMLSFAVLVGYLLLIPFSSQIIYYSIGPAYSESSEILKILLAASFLSIITVPFAAIFFSFKKAEWYFSVGGIMQVGIIVLGNAVLVPMFGLAGSAWTRVAAKSVFLVFTIVTASLYLRSIHSEKR
ncbi:MAG: oligosaccharide flippase family protein [Microgenomates group bacterium]